MQRDLVRFFSCRRHVVLFVIGVLMCGVSLYVGAATTSTVQTSLSILSSGPAVSAVKLNNVNAIVLTPNATTTVFVNASISSSNGCSDIFTNGTTSVLVYRSGITSSTCETKAANSLNCYKTTLTENDCSGGNLSADATGSVDIWYFADATDVSSSYESQNWMATVIATDGSNATGTADSAGVELLNLLAIGTATSSINYGTVNAGSNTGATNQIVRVEGKGNTSTTLNLSGTAMVLAGNSIATSSQHYATSSFTYGGASQSLSDTPASVSGFSVTNPPIGTWRAGRALTNATADHGAIANRDFMYVMGGFDGTNSHTTTTVWRSAVNGSGTLGVWNADRALPSPRRQFGVVVSDDTVYVMGGFATANGTTPTSSVLRSAINTVSGVLDTWAADQALPATRTGFGSATYNGFVYVAGGLGNTLATSSVLYAPVNANHSLGSWVTTTALPTSTVNLTSQSLVAHDGFLYFVGGSAGGAATSSVWVATIHFDGTLSGWSLATTLPSGLQYTMAFADADVFYSIGGQGASYSTSTVFAPIVNTSGTLSSLSLANDPYPVPTARGGLATAHYGFVYILGGYARPPGELAAATSTVNYAPIPSQDTYWGLSVSGGTLTGTYNGVNTFTAVFQP